MGQLLVCRCKLLMSIAESDVVRATALLILEFVHRNSIKVTLKILHFNSFLGPEIMVAIAIAAIKNNQHKTAN